MKTPSLYVLYCTFNTLIGELPFLFPLKHPQESFNSPISNLGCKIIVKKDNLGDEEALVAFNDLFKNFP